MFRTSLRARRGRLGSSLAIALAFAGGTAVSMAAAAPAYAKDKNKDEAKPAAKTQYSPAFVAAYKPLEALLAKAQDAASAEPGRALVPPMLAAATTDDDRYAAGNGMLQLGLKLNDKDMQQQALTLELDSGKVPADKQAQFNYYVGGFAWDKKDYATANKYLTRAYQLGYRENDIDWLVAESYFQQNGQQAQGMAALKQMEQDAEAKGGALSEKSMRSALKAAYDAHDLAQISDWAAALARHYPSPDIWNMTLSVVKDSDDLSSDEVVDVFRLMKLNGALKTGRDYIDYINAVDVRRMSNEGLPVIQEGIAKGLLKATDPFVKESLDVANQRAPQDKAQAAEIENDGRKGATGVPARAAGDNYLSLGNPQKAAEMYQLASQKGGVDASQMQMRLGVAQAEAGNYDAARQQFQQVTGKRQPVAKMWLAYIDAKQSPPPAAPAAPAAK